MLTSLLPGLRELRTPLVSGILFLLATALFFRDAFDPVSSDAGRSDTLNAIIEWVGRPGLVAAVWLVAYLVGSIVAAIVGRIKRWGYEHQIGKVVKRYDEIAGDYGERHRPGYSVIWAVFQKKGKVRSPWLFPYSVDGLDSLLREIAQAPEYAQDTRSVPAGAIFTEALVDGGRRLLLANPAYYSEFDRRQSEAELRDNLIVPLLAVIFALMGNIKLDRPVEVVIVCVVVVSIVGLFVVARQLDKIAYDLVLLMISDHTVSLPTLDRIDWLSHERRSRPQADERPKDPL